MEWGMEMEQILRLDEKIDENAIAIDFVTSEIKNSPFTAFSSSSVNVSKRRCQDSARESNPGSSFFRSMLAMECRASL